jgi:hypothetical protein
MVDALRGTRPWVVFIAVLAVIAAGFMVLAGGGMAVGSLFVGGFAGEFGGMGGVALLLLYALVYVVGAVVYACMGYFLFRYAGSIRAFVTGGDTRDMELALSHQRSFWRVVGVITIIYLGMMALVLLAAIVYAVVVGLR